MEKINIIKKSFEQEKERTAISYVRVSTKRQEKYGLSLDVQSRLINDFCEKKNIKIINRYIEQKSAKNIDSRPELLNALKDLINGIANTLVVADKTRPFRNMKDAINKLDEFKKMGIDIIAIRDNIDTATQMGKIYFQVSSVFSELERELAKERVEAVMEDKVERGINVGKSPFGYKRTKKSEIVKIDLIESEIIKEIFKLTINKVSYDKICKIYNLNYKSYYNIIRNPFYIGKIIYDGEVYQGVHKLIIDEEIFNLANSKIKGRSNLNSN